MDTEQNKPEAKNRNPLFVGFLSFFGGISQDIFTPLLPVYYTTVLGFNKTFIGIAEGVVTAGSYLFAVVSGFFSDKFKKQKSIIFAGYFLSFLARPLLALFTSAGAVLGLRFADGVGKGIKDPPKDVLIAGSAESSVRGKSFGIVRMLDTLGSVAGPLILFGLLYLLKGSALLYHYILLFAAVPLVLTLIILALGVKEVDGKPADTITSEEKPIPKQYFIFLAIMALFTIGNSSDAFLILRAQSLGVTLLEIPLAVALFNFIYAIFAVPLGSLSDRIGRIPTMLIGWAAYAVVYLGFALAAHVYAIWILYGLYGVYYATNLGVAKAFLADLVGTEHRGRAFGIYGTTIGLATLLASFIAGSLWDKMGPHAPFYFGAVMAGFAAILLFLFSKKLKFAEASKITENE